MKTRSPGENSRCASTFKACVAPAVAIMSSLEGRGGEGRGGEGERRRRSREREELEVVDKGRERR